VIDWQGPALGLAANDLAYWIVFSLPVDLRREQEETLPRRYHSALEEHGVSGYGMRSSSQHSG
jgi:hypothetical protein